MVEPRQNTTNAVRVLILLALAMAGAVVTGIIGFVMTAMQVDIMWTIVLQDVLMFILPAILLAVICYKRPWRFLEIDRPPSWLALVIVVVVWAVSMPAMNWLVEWNQNIHLPASMAALEQTLRDSEDAMEQITNQLLTLNSVGDLVAGILVVGVMAGVSEEFFFRGALFGIMRRGRANIHIVMDGRYRLQRHPFPVLRFCAAHVARSVVRLPIGVDTLVMGACHRSCSKQWYSCCVPVARFQPLYRWQRTRAVGRAR